MNKKFHDKLKTLFADKGLSKEELERLAEIGSQNLTEASTDEEIDNAASGVTPFVELMQKVGNRYATSVEKKYEGYVKPVEKQSVSELKSKPVETESKPKDVTPTKADINKLIEASVAEALKPFRQQAEAKRLQALLDGNEKVKAIPKAFRRNYKLEKEEDLENVANRIESDYTALKQELVNSGEFVAPPSTSTKEEEGSELIKELQGMSKDNSTK